MTKPTMELVEEYGDRRESVGWCDAADREKLERAAQEEADALLSEIRQRLEAMERDAARYRWLRGEVDGPVLPLAQVVWKLNGNRESHNWTNLADGLSLDEHVDAAMAEGE